MKSRQYAYLHENCIIPVTLFNQNKLHIFFSGKMEFSDVTCSSVLNLLISFTKTRGDRCYYCQKRHELHSVEIKKNNSNCFLTKNSWKQFLSKNSVKSPFSLQNHYAHWFHEIFFFSSDFGFFHTVNYTLFTISAKMCVLYVSKSDARN